MNTSPSHGHQQLDLSIPNMDSLDAEQTARTALASLHGVHAVRLIERGAWIDYDASLVSPSLILSTLHHAGIRAALFQDSASGLSRPSKV